ncbi:hypothetical protein GCM10012275_38440 [Longimycelium tulufanense]|uniref:DUF2637 domain-containing protein n=1 Tax=Longimycelium tulufanense TaxID=907463 RepID=A0A8J3CA65_9PSEU|nr:DUF2637 domain-containing protein [Longimycelium tulufanense]GGM64203.1 hypothetical protein GCM10012275_38440 [Longimycelium tulufanense]
MTTTATNGVDLEHRIRQLLEDARRAGRRPPGRPTLRKETGATEHQIRQILDRLENTTATARRTLAPASRQPATNTTTAPPPEPGTGEPGDPPPPEPATGPAAADNTGANDPPPSRQPDNPASHEPPAPPSPTTSTSDPGEHQPTTAPTGGRLVAWTGFIFGSLVSIAANVLAAWLPPPSANADWTPTLAAQIGAAVWPTALLLSVEVLARVRWPRGWAWILARYGGVGIVALGSAVISYGHIHDLLAAWGYSVLAASVGPLVVDGLMVISGFALLAPTGGRAGDPARPPAASTAPERSPA